jgi:hypothetical protein
MLLSLHCDIKNVNFSLCLQQAMVDVYFFVEVVLINLLVLMFFGSLQPTLGQSILLDSS